MDFRKLAELGERAVIALERIATAEEAVQRQYGDRKWQDELLDIQRRELKMAEEHVKKFHHTHES